MPTLQCSAVCESDVTLVQARLASGARRRVSVEATHEAPVWPPRRQGVPAAGWSDDGWTGIVPADGTVALGYATSAIVDGRPLRIAASGPPDDEGDLTAEHVIRSLGDARPPRDAVADDGPGDQATGTPRVDAGGLDAIAVRLERAEALARVDSVEAARAAVDEAGGMPAVRDLAAQVERDRERLEALRRRVDELRSRGTVEIPVEDLARLV